MAMNLPARWIERAAIAQNVNRKFEPNLTIFFKVALKEQLRLCRRPLALGSNAWRPTARRSLIIAAVSTVLYQPVPRM